MTIRSKQTAYWSLTGVFAALMLLSGSLYVAGAPMIRDTMAHLGYPPYLLVILGVAKLVGSVALLQYRAPTLREWAYAGFTIDLIGATASHLFAGDAIGVASVPALFLLMLAASYSLKPVRHGTPTTRDYHAPAIAA